MAQGQGGAVDNDWRRPSPRLATLRRAEAAVVTVALAGAGAAIGAAVSGTAVLVGVAIGLVLGLLGLLWAQRRVRAWGYAEREEDLLVRRGVMVRRLSVVPYGRMQYIDVTAGPFERLLGLATVQMHTAAAATNARIPGLEADEAARLRDQLARLGESSLAGL
jgi:membrane protein YdbS with pleckstrin-like domain